ncbi:MAG: glutaminyl-peptide cyclotransferase [Rikenellaceae bacterium]|nr:glutaminyl-peptide cyclotransferase [Rikenellaceae bacterium]
MSREKFKSAFFLLSILLFCSCGGVSTNAEKKVRKSTENSIKVSPSRSDIFVQGTDVRISYESPLDFDSVRIWIDGMYVGKIDTVYVHKTSLDSRVGYIPFILEFYVGGDKESRSSEFFLKPANAPVLYGYNVRNVYSHDNDAYTQGLFLYDGYLYEGTGLEGKSSLRKVEINGNVVRKIDNDPEYFGEGITMIGNKLYQLTWKHGRGFVYDLETFEKIDEFGYSGEGWGLATDGEILYMSNGSNRIKVIDPANFNTIRYIDVFTDQKPVNLINELEMIDGELWANVYLTDYIIKINPQTGVVTGLIDMSGLLSPQDITAKTDVLNGIAYDSDKNRIFVTGKNWNKLFEIEVIKK